MVKLKLGFFKILILILFVRLYCKYSNKIYIVLDEIIVNNGIFIYNYVICNKSWTFLSIFLNDKCVSDISRSLS